MVHNEEIGEKSSLTSLQNYAKLSERNSLCTAYQFTVQTEQVRGQTLCRVTSVTVESDLPTGQ